jgi:hypothetical protein
MMLNFGGLIGSPAARRQASVPEVSNSIMAADYQHETREAEARRWLPDIRRGMVMTDVMSKNSESQRKPRHYSCEW